MRGAGRKQNRSQRSIAPSFPSITMSSRSSTPVASNGAIAHESSRVPRSLQRQAGSTHSSSMYPRPRTISIMQNTAAFPPHSTFDNDDLRLTCGEVISAFRKLHIDSGGWEPARSMGGDIVMMLRQHFVQRFQLCDAAAVDGREMEAEVLVHSRALLQLLRGSKGRPAHRQIVG